MFPPQPQVGLCLQCEFLKSVHSAKGSTFYLCQRAESDPRFRKYPPLPVLRCPGYVTKAPSGAK